MRILIVKTSSMGDVIHTLPSLTDALQNIPNITFDWVIEEEFAQIPKWHIAVNQVIPVAIRRWRKAWFSPLIKSEIRAFYKKIRIQCYDAIIDAQGLIKSAMLITRIARGTKYGMNWQTIREPLAAIFYNHCYYIKKQQHAVERIRELFARSLGYKKPETIGDYGIIQRFFKKNLPVRKSFIMFLYAASQHNKQWPETMWRKLIDLIQPTGIFIKLLWNTKYEFQQAKRLANGFTHVEILPKLSLTQIAKYIMKAQAVISIDTGLSHLAAALNRPNIILFGPTDPSLIGGYGKNQYQVISKTGQMNGISADYIFMFFRKICKLHNI